MNSSMASRTAQETRGFYDHISRVYDLLAESSEGPIKDVTVHKLAPSRGERILEIGCGTGHVLVTLAASVGRQGEVVGLDISSGMLAAARETLAHHDSTPQVSLVCGNAINLPLRDHSVNAVFMSFTLELFGPDEVPRVLAECRRVLAPGGRIAGASVSSIEPHGLSYDVYDWAHRRFPTLVDCRPIALERAITTAGFRVTARTLQSMWVPVEIVAAEAGPLVS